MSYTVVPSVNSSTILFLFPISPISHIPAKPHRSRRHCPIDISVVPCCGRSHSPSQRPALYVALPAPPPLPSPRTRPWPLRRPASRRTPRGALYRAPQETRKQMRHQQRSPLRAAGAVESAVDEGGWGIWRRTRISWSARARRLSRCWGCFNAIFCRHSRFRARRTMLRNCWKFRLWRSRADADSDVGELAV